MLMLMRACVCVGALLRLRLVFTVHVSLREYCVHAHLLGGGATGIAATVRNDQRMGACVRARLRPPAPATAMPQAWLAWYSSS